MREKQHGGRQNTPVLVTFRITRPAAPDVLSQPSPARNIFHSPGNITSQWTQLLCTAHYTPPGAALKPEVLDVMWSNFRKDISLSLLSRVPKYIMSQNKRGDIYSKSIAVGGLVNYHKYEAQETSGIILFPFLWGRRNATARCSADIIYKTQKRVCGVCWVSASPCAAGQCPCHVMDTCHVTRVRPCPGHVCPAGGGTRCDVIQTPLAQSPLWFKIFAELWQQQRPAAP